ncbi:MAG: alpha/beta fold hydrolase, partial [Chitinophagia bacterium]|nr:alpha/beta fold hydrolase [Chitinophagia bacterium]
MTPIRQAVSFGPYLLACWLTCIAGQAARAQAPCSSTLPPVVFVHGFLGSGDNWAEHARRLEAAGWCPDRIQAFDWNSIDRGSRPDSLLDLFIRQVLRRTSAGKVVLVAHSAGGG